MDMFGLLYKIVVFPGFLFTLAVGMLSSWVDRKISARLQWRKGPPWFQPLADVVKLLGKETIIPEGAPKLLFLGAPLFGFAAAILSAMLLWNSSQTGFIGDLIVVFYLLAIPAIAVLIGGSASRNPLSAVGVSREMTMMLSYELPFVLAVFTAALKAKSIMLGDILAYQAGHGMFIASFSGAIAFLAAILVIQAKLSFVPFDVSEAEQELAAGPLLEYSGPPLALFKLTRILLLAVLPLFLVILFMGGIDVYFPIKYLSVLTLVILLKNTNPRLRIDQALRFFWGPVTILAALGIALSMLGL